MRERTDEGSAEENLRYRVAQAGDRLYGKLVDLDLSSCGISEYNQSYLSNSLSAGRSSLQIYGHLLSLCLAGNAVEPERFVLIDYGGGCGLLSFLAAEAGVGTVVYNDIYDVSCADVGRLSSLLSLPLGHVVRGDVDVLLAYVRKNNVRPDAIASNDVLEHIYDVEEHFRSLLGGMPDRGFRIVYASSANGANLRCVRVSKAKQAMAEYSDRKKERGHKERDSLRAYLDLRTDIISAYAPDLSSETVGRLASDTRGLNKADIEACVDEFKERGRISYRCNHPTNTCDPNTGNWCEQLISFESIGAVFRREGVPVRIMPGYYNTYGTKPKRMFKAFLNFLLGLMGRRGLFIAPYYVVYADTGQR